MKLTIKITDKLVGDRLDEFRKLFPSDINTRGSYVEMYLTNKFKESEKVKVTVEKICLTKSKN